MIDVTYTGSILEQYRVAELERRAEIVRAHRERMSADRQHGSSPTRPHGRPLAAWFRALLAGRTRRAAIA